jgi:hypothetical protein
MSDKEKRLAEIALELSKLIAEVLPLLDEWNESIYGQEFLTILEKDNE